MVGSAADRIRQLEEALESRTVIGQAVVHGYDTAALDQRLTPLGYDLY